MAGRSDLLSFAEFDSGLDVESMERFMKGERVCAGQRGRWRERTVWMLERKKGKREEEEPQSLSASQGGGAELRLRLECPRARHADGLESQTQPDCMGSLKRSAENIWDLVRRNDPPSAKVGRSKGRERLRTIRLQTYRPRGRGRSRSRRLHVIPCSGKLDRLPLCEQRLLRCKRADECCCCHQSEAGPAYSTGKD